MQNLKAMLPCLVCGDEIDAVFSETQPSEGTQFSTYGHYGSTFWDSFNGEELVLNVCDDCLEKHKNRLARHKRLKFVYCEGFIVGREWLKREQVPYFDGPEDEDRIEIEPEEIGVLEGYKIEWAENWKSTKESALELANSRSGEEKPE